MCMFSLASLIVVLLFPFANANNSSEVIFQPGDMRGSYYSIRHLVIDEEHKFIMCPIEKVASTMFRQLFFRLSGDPYWFEQPYHKAHRAAKQIGLARMSEMFNDPSFTKAIVVRDPALRMLSAYSHFFVNRNALPRYAKKIYDLGENNTFGTFVRLSLAKQIANLHWNPQHRFCGFHKFAHKFNFIGSYEQLATHGRMLFDRVSPTLWDEYGAQGWAMTSLFNDPSRFANGSPIVSIEEFVRDTPNNYNNGDCIFCDNYAVHKFNCSTCTVKQTREEMLTPELWKTIRESDLYKKDYEIFRQVADAVNGPLDPDLYDKYPF